MEEENKVSVWVFKKKNEKRFQRYIEQKFSRSGDEMTSKFMSHFGIDFYNHDSQEAMFLGESFTFKDFEGASYIESFSSNLSNSQFEGFDSIMFIYDFEYDISSIKKEPSHGRFLGAFDYKPQKIDPSLWGG